MRLPRFGLLLATAALAGCSGSPPAPAPTTPPATTASATPTPLATGVVEVDCLDNLDTEAGPYGGAGFFDAVMLPTDLLGTEETRDPVPQLRLFSKHGLVVRTGVSVELILDPSFAGHARIGWGSPAEPTMHLRIPACEGGTEWIAFAGGYWVDAPACLAITVRVGNRDAFAHVAVGKAC